MLIRFLSLGLIIKVFGGIVGFSSNLAVARLYGIDEAGLYYSFINLIWLVSTIMMFGTEQSSVRQLAASHDDNSKNKIMFIVFNNSIVCLFGFFVCCFLFFLNEFFSIGLIIPWDIGFFYLSALVVCSALYKLMIEFLKGSGLYLWYNFFQGAYFPVLLLVAVAVAALMGLNDIYFLFYSVLFIVFLGWVGAFLLVKRKVGIGIKSIFKIKLDYQVSKEAFFLWGASISDAMIAFSGSVVLVYFVELSQVSIFHVSTRIVVMVAMVVAVVNSITVIKINSLLKQGNIKECVDYAKKLSTLSLVIVFPMLVMLFLFGDMVLSLFGDGFSAGYTCLVILLVSAAINAATSSCSVVLIGLEKGLDHTWITMISLVIFVFFAIMLAPVGAIGMAIAFSSAAILKSLITVFMIKKYTGCLLVPDFNVRNVLKISL